MMDLFGELAEPSRRCILAELRSGPKTVSEIVDATGLKQPNVSNHLARMRVRGTVRATKVGRLVYYAFGSSEVELVLQNALVEITDRPGHFNFSEGAEEFAARAVEGRESDCFRLVDRAITSGNDIVALYQDLITPAMGFVGAWWTDGQIDVGQEHLATGITERIMARVVQLYPTHKRHDGVAVLGCPEGNHHTVGLRMVGDYMKIQGWQVMFLGGNLPSHAFVAAVRRHGAKVALIGCGSIESLDSTVELIRSLRESGHRLKIGLGGWLVTSSPETFSGAPVDFSAVDLRSFATECLPQLERETDFSDDCKLS